jgi:hypothetical protein
MSQRVRAKRGPMTGSAKCGTILPCGTIPDVARNQACADCVNLSALLIRATLSRSTLVPFALLPSSGVSAASSFLFSSRPPPPNEGRAERREAVSSVVALSVKARTTFARRGRPGQTGTGLSALQPWRFWARSALRLRSRLRLRCAGDPGSPGVASGRPRVPNLPGRGYGPRRGTPILAPPSGSSPDDAPRERGWALYSSSAYSSQ